MRSCVSLIVLIAVAILGRLVPHPLNFTPMLAVSIMAGVVYKSRWASVGAMFTAMIFTDLLLGFHNPYVQATVYGSLLLPAFLGSYVKPKQLVKAGAFALCGSVFFFLTTNFACWAGEGFYPHTWAGLMESYTLALPFFKNTIAGDQFWTVTLLGIYSYVPNLAPVPKLLPE